MVANGTVSPDKAAIDVNGKIDEKKEVVEKMEEDVKDNKNDKTKEVEANKDAPEVEEADVKDNKGEEDKGNKEPESEPMEVDGKKDAEANDSKEEKDNKEEENQEEIPEEKRPKKGSKKKGSEEKSNSKKKEKEPMTPVAPTIERPVRARKAVERLVAVIENDTAKEFHILKGRGTVLKDIPNVSYKLSKKKVIDDTLKLLHTILFGRRGKAAQVKSNILQFSGFVWPENEEKHKLKVKEKLDKLNKEKLLEFCDIFDMTASSTNKEDIVVKLIDFMSSPHATSSELLAEKEQSTKGKKPKSASKKSSSKKQKTKSINEEDKKREAETDDSEEESDVDEKDNEEREEDEKSEDIIASEENVSESESEEESGKKRKRSSTKSKSSKKESGGKPKEKKEVATPKKTSTSPQKKKPVKSKVAVEGKPAPKEKSGKKAVKAKEKPKISDGDLRTAICEIFKEVDFNTATFTDIVKLLAKRFDTDLTSRKASIKLLIQEELTKIADAEEEDDEEEEEAGGKQASGQGVKA